MSATNSNRQTSNNENDDSDDQQPPHQIPYRRDRTPSIVVQSLGLSFQKDSNITGSIELPGDDEDSSPNASETSDLKSSNSGTDEQQNANVCDSSAESPKGSLSSLPNSSSPGATSPSKPELRSQFNAARPGQPPSLGTTNRRLSLNIGSTAPRRQSLTVDGLTSAFVNPTLKDSQGSISSSSGNATGSLRNKVALKPGHSLMGWIKLASTAKDLSGTNGKIIEVTPEELAKHDKENDCWVALKGNVYNVTTYLHYHPGGVDELMRGAGRDATELFNEVHRWVNYESILAKTLVGPYKLDSPHTPVGRANFKTITGSPPGNNKPTRQDPTVAQKPPRRQSIALTVPSPNKYQSLLLNSNSNLTLNTIQQPPTYVIIQDKSCIKLKVQDLATLQLIRSRNVICDLNAEMELQLSIILASDWLYRVHLRLDQQVDEKLTADFSNDDKTVTIQLNKKEQAIWNKIGTSLDLNDSLCEMTLADKVFRPCKLLSKQKLTRDTYLFEFKLSNTLMYIPISWHVLIREHSPELETAKQQQQNSNNNSKMNSFVDQRVHKNYTPVLPSLFDTDGLTDESGFMDKLYFIIKIYNDGLVTSMLHELKIGDNVDISDYQCVDFDIETLVKSSTKHWILLAAGTGLTPYCRAIPYLLSQPEELVETVTLLFFNKTERDIIWRDQFDKLSEKNGNRFKFVHVLSNEHEDSKWTGRRGKVNKELIGEYVDSKSPDELQILSCGPRAFTQLTKSIANELNLQKRLCVFHG